jgi:hypothetical protein
MSARSRGAPRAALVLAALAYALAAAHSWAQSGLAFRESLDHPAIGYTTAQPADAVAALARGIENGTTRLRFDSDSGYLPALLEALELPTESQLAVFSHTSFQADKITVENPRVIFFNDSVAVGWVRGGQIEVAAHDPRLGYLFYHLDQRQAARPAFVRSDADCLECHRTWETLAVPGLLVLSTFPPQSRTDYATGGVTDHRSPFGRRWAGWYVTGRPGSLHHMGNKPNPREGDTSASVVLESLKGRFDLTGYPTPYSDIVALLTFEHQTRMTNLLTLLAWEARVAAFARRPAAELAEVAAEVVDYLLFVDEAPLSGPVEGTSGFAEAFAARGPADSKGRSLRQFDLDRRLMRFPCSYMIYSPAFEALAPLAKEAVYQRMWQVLSGQDADPRYLRLSVADRRAIVEILRDTKKDLPDYFSAAGVR